MLSPKLQDKTKSKLRTDPTIKPLTEEIAFDKGVQLFVEIFFVYGVVFAILAFEVKKAVTSNKSKAELLREVVAQAQLNNELMHDL